MKRAPRTGAPAHSAGAAAALILSAALLFGGAPAGAQSPAPAVPAAAGSADTAPSPENVARLQKLAGELRCLVCQNQTLADSHAELAVELRREVEAMIVRGDSDEQIKQYLVQRYGDFVLYRPPMQGNTVLLWVGPFALLGVGAIVWIVVQRRSRRAAAAASGPAPDAPEAAARHQRTRDLLED